MSSDDRSPEHGFHPGELAVQQRAGVRLAAARLEAMLDPGRLSEGVARFLGGQTFAAITARARDGLLWTSPLIGEPGFLEVTDPVTLRVHAVPSPGDPLHRLGTLQPVGMIVVDYERRRRFRLNGTLDLQERPDALTIRVSEAFGNCPQYLPRRTLAPSAPGPRRDDSAAMRPEASTLTDADRAVIGTADTFILGTTHPERGNDASHRGGRPGFVRVEGSGGGLWWPDYAGNGMFTSLGNLAVDHAAALLFLDFVHRTSLHLNGTAELVDVARGSAGDDDQTGRLVAFTPTLVARSDLAAHSRLLDAYPRNPPVRD